MQPDTGDGSAHRDPEPDQTEPMSYGDWVRLLHERFDAVESAQSAMATRILTFTGVFVVSLGVIVGYFDLPALTKSDLRAIASVWLLVAFMGFALLLIAARVKMLRSGERLFATPPEMATGMTTAIAMMAGIFLSGMVMSILLVKDWGSPASTLVDSVNLALVVLTYLAGLFFVVTPWAVARYRRSPGMAERWKRFGEQIARDPRTGRTGWIGLFSIFVLGALFSVWSALQAIPQSTIGLHGITQLVGAGYVALAALLATIVGMLKSFALDEPRDEIRVLILQALDRSVPLSAIREGYTQILRSITEEKVGSHPQPP